MTLLHELLEAQAHRSPTAEAVRWRGEGRSYAELHVRAGRLAAALHALGVQRGARIAIQLLNRPELIETALASSRLGAIFVPINPMLKSRQVRHILRDCGASVLVTSSALSASVQVSREQTPSLRHVITCNDSAFDTGSPQLAVLDYERLCRGSTSLASTVAIDRDPAAILYTSGSTGSPKGVVVSHDNLVSGARIVAGYLNNVASDRILAALPLSFDYGLSQATTAFFSGACVVLTQFVLPAALIAEIAAERVTGLAGVPTMWAHLAAADWPAGAADSLRYITNSGGALPPAVLQRLQNRLGSTQIYCMYGLTEAFRSTYLEPSALPERLGSIGKALPDQEILLLRPDGSHCAPGEIGELVHRGSLVTLGYWNDSQATRERFRPLPACNPGLREECAVWSGDLVRADEDGYLYFVGRNDQLIKTSGHRVSATEIEEVVLETPGVVEAAAMGLPDEVLGQRIAILLVADASANGVVADAVRQQCRAQLPPFMMPAHICVVPSLPRNANGKHDRAAILALAQSLIDAQLPGSERMKRTVSL